jgi:mono/diheme cytochrome c family protein
MSFVVYLTPFAEAGTQENAACHEKMEPDMLRHGILPIALILAISGLALLPSPARAADTKADEQSGAVLFRDKGCAFCHGVGGVGGKKGPVLTDIRTDKLWPPAKITKQILEGGQKMPPFSDSLTEKEIAQLVAYLRAKHRPVPPPSAEPSPAPPGN